MHCVSFSNWLVIFLDDKQYAKHLICIVTGVPRTLENLARGVNSIVKCAGSIQQY